MTGFSLLGGQRYEIMRKAFSEAAEFEDDFGERINNHLSIA
jgi:hypothetical protein